MRVELSAQVLEFLQSLAPQPRRAVRRGIRGLEEGVGDLKTLRDSLEGYHRLRVMSYRLIYFFDLTDNGGERFIQAVFLQRREFVCGQFAATLGKIDGNAESLADPPQS